MKTNRDFYLFMQKISAEAPNDRNLEEFLYHICCGLNELNIGEGLSLSQFAGVLEDSIRNEAIIAGQSHCDTEISIFIQLQLTDLQGMRDSGALHNKYRCFGVDAPSGRRWYNFTLQSYLEAAAVGAFGGWEESSDSPRQLVPGPVAGIGTNGKIVTMKPEDTPNPTYEVTLLYEEDIIDFLTCGQMYE